MEGRGGGWMDRAEPRWRGECRTSMSLFGMGHTWRVMCRCCFPQSILLAWKRHVVLGLKSSFTYKSLMSEVTCPPARHNAPHNCGIQGTKVPEGHGYPCELTTRLTLQEHLRGGRRKDTSRALDNIQLQFNWGSLWRNGSCSVAERHFAELMCACESLPNATARTEPELGARTQTRRNTCNFITYYVSVGE